MRVLFLSQRIPHPPDRGDRITTFHLLRHLRSLDCEIRVGCLLEDERDSQAAVTLRKTVTDLCAPRIHRKMRKLTSLRGVLTGQALTLPYFSQGKLRRTVNRWISEHPPDLIFAYSSSMAQYALEVPPGIPRIMHFAELDSDKWRQYAAVRRGIGRWVFDREYRRLLEFERKVARTFEASIVVSDTERELFTQQIPGVTPHVLPNGVDVDHFTSRTHANRDPHTLVFTGVMDYEPNVDGMSWFVADCWPAIRSEFPNAKLLIVGNRPAPEIRRLGDQDGIEVTGWVDETPPWFDRAGVAIAPLRLARGVQNKVLEAMSMGVPVVATPQASQGLGDVPSDTLVVAAQAESTTAAVLELMRDPAKARAIGQRGADFVRANFHWKNTFQKFDEIVAAARSAAAR